MLGRTARVSWNFRMAGDDKDTSYRMDSLARITARQLT
jgi:hypothetical protein